MARRSNGSRANAQDVAAEIIRRAAGNDDSGMTAYVLRLARPPTFQERLQLAAARLQRRPIVIMPHKSASMDEWIARYRPLKDC
jgi:hypothetical protein